MREDEENARPSNDKVESFWKIHSEGIVDIGLHLTDAPSGVIGVLHEMTGI